MRKTGEDAEKYYYTLYLAKLVNDNVGEYKPKVEEVEIASPRVYTNPTKLFKIDDNEDDYVEIYTREGNVIKVNIDIAKSPQERALGLSYRKYVGSYDGMWFVFEEDTDGGFWMKDMVIPLDIIFVDSSGFIVDIKENQQICEEDFCPTIKPSKPYRYVLEVNANFCKENGITIGDSIQQHIKTSDDV